MKAAKSLGITIPQSLLQQADQQAACAKTKEAR